MLDEYYQARGWDLHTGLPKEEKLKELGFYKGAKDGVKLLGNGEISYPVEITVNKVSKEAKKKIEAAGGKVELI